MTGVENASRARTHFWKRWPGRLFLAGWLFSPSLVAVTIALNPPLSGEESSIAAGMYPWSAFLFLGAIPTDVIERPGIRFAAGAFVVLAWLQFAFYGLVLGLAIERPARSCVSAFLILVAAHVTAAALLLRSGLTRSH